MTLKIVFTVLLISGLLGLTMANALARRNSSSMQLVILLFVLLLLVTPLTYDILLVKVLYQVRLSGTFLSVVPINIVQSLSVVIMVMIPFIEQINPCIKAAAWIFIARTDKLLPAHPAAAAAARHLCCTATGPGTHHGPSGRYALMLGDAAELHPACDSLMLLRIGAAQRRTGWLAMLTAVKSWF
jgi:hypothetical protein